MLTTQYIQDFITKENYLFLMPKINDIFKKYKLQIFNLYDINTPEEIEKIRYSLDENLAKKRIYISSIMENIFDIGDFGNINTFSWFVNFVDFIYIISGDKDILEAQEDTVKVAYLDYYLMLESFYHRLDYNKNFKTTFNDIKKIYKNLLEDLENLLK